METLTSAGERDREGAARPRGELSMSGIARIRLYGVEVLLLVLTAAQLGAQRPGPPPVPVDPAAAERGKALYSPNCSFCHGSQGTGTEQAPSLVRNFLVTQDRSGEVIGPVIKDGRPAAGMPAFASLQPAEIADLVAYLHLRNSEVRGGGLPETALLTGDAKAGQAYFNGTGKCNTCHSVTGDLKVIGSKYTPLPLTIAFLTPTTNKPVQVKVTQPSGKTVSGVLKDIDEFVVSLTDSGGEYHSWSRETLRSAEVMDPLAPHRAMLIKYTDPDIRNLLAYLVTLK
jgi:mono/diheme cytochrome c family protein